MKSLQKSTLRRFVNFSRSGTSPYPQQQHNHISVLQKGNSILSSSCLLTTRRTCSSTTEKPSLSSSSLFQTARACAPTPLPGCGISISSLSSSPSSGQAPCDTQGDAPDKPVVIRARLERCRGRGKVAFLHLRQPPFDSIQAVCEGKELAAQARAISLESIVDVEGLLRPTATPIQSTSCTRLELHVQRIKVVSAAETPLPFPLRDENTTLHTRLNHRVMDLRTTRSAAVVRIVSALCQSFRERLLRHDFIEIHTPKLIATASEGGSNVFTVDYFGQPAYLAQSPQLYKEMAIMGDCMRVFEVAPVFRAENSLTHRHVTEFVGLDGEMVIHESYTEVLDVLEELLCGVLEDLVVGQRGLLEKLLTAQQDAICATMEDKSEAPTMATPDFSFVAEVAEEVIEQYGLGDDSAKTRARKDPYHARLGHTHHPHAARRVLRLSFADAARLLQEKGGAEVLAGSSLPLEDFTLPQERRLGELLKARYGVDLYVIDLFPSAARPFYTMPLNPADDPNGPTRSFDVYLRGEEICSGAQRIADVALLRARLKTKMVEEEGVRDYMDSFRYGAWPHGGFGLGMERIALFLLQLGDIRQVSMFPRDPKRIRP